MYPRNSGNTKFSQIFGFAVSCAPAVDKEATKGTQGFWLCRQLCYDCGQRGDLGDPGVSAMPSALLRLWAKPAVNLLTELGLRRCRHCSLPSARATKLMAKSLPSVDLQLTAKKVIADKILADTFADSSLTAKPLPSVKLSFAVSSGCRQTSRFQ